MKSLMVSGRYTGCSHDDPPMVGIIIGGKRRLLRWFSCFDPSLLTVFESLSRGSEVQLKIVQDPVSDIATVVEVLDQDGDILGRN